MNNCYVYRHIRLDKNEPFYIGIGTHRNRSNSHNSIYERSIALDGRNVIWKKITNKTKWKSQIFLDNLTREEACEKEIELIALYGRIINGGILANISIGGDLSALGTVHTQEYRDNASKRLKGIKRHPSVGKKVSETKLKSNYKHSEETKLKISESKLGKQVGGKNPSAKKVINVKTGEIFDCAKDIAIANGWNCKTFRGKLSGHKKNNTDFKYLISVP